RNYVQAWTRATASRTSQKARHVPHRGDGPLRGHAVAECRINDRELQIAMCPGIDRGTRRCRSWNTRASSISYFASLFPILLYSFGRDPL
ncbi:hypothetical protein HYDPIDRAFT_107213, partial [Hydnomerulius pinastri MD-312]